MVSPSSPLPTISGLFVQVYDCVYRNNNDNNDASPSIANFSWRLYYIIMTPDIFIVSVTEITESINDPTYQASSVTSPLNISNAGMVFDKWQVWFWLISLLLQHCTQQITCREQTGECGWARPTWPPPCPPSWWSLAGSSPWTRSSGTRDPSQSEQSIAVLTNQKPADTWYHSGAWLTE